MQTFLPYADFQRTARVLDYKRLGKQRSETQIIWMTLTGVYAAQGRKGWPHHPATRMWEGHANTLLHYGIEICAEWERRGYADEGTTQWFIDRVDWNHPLTMPHWMGDDAFHRSHRSQLIQKWRDYYLPYWPNEADNLGYYWPTPEAAP